MKKKTQSRRLLRPDDRQQLLFAFGQRLKALREEKRLSQHQVAMRSGMEAGNYAKYEGKREPGLAVLMLLAKGLNVHPRELLDFDFEIS